jgi:hypothetical protein
MIRPYRNPCLFLRDFGRMRVVLWRKGYDAHGQSGQRVFVAFWRPSYEPTYGGRDGSWELRLLWLELRWKVHGE